MTECLRNVRVDDCTDIEMGGWMDGCECAQVEVGSHLSVVRTARLVLHLGADLCPAM